jgi:hypothetical protein
MDREPNRTALRAARRLERLHKRLGNCPAVCILCGYANPMFLIVVTLEWLKAHMAPISLLQNHHLWGRKHDLELTVPVCPNCHVEITENYRQEDVRMRPEPDPIANEVVILRAKAVFHEKRVRPHPRNASWLGTQSRTSLSPRYAYCLRAESCTASNALVPGDATRPQSEGSP